uniref:Uncharacterized protein n=1 Tax=Anopheles gambiae TaxID=7165 RepID=A0A453YZU4_ANOGA
MIVVRALIIWCCLLSIACARPASVLRTIGRRKGSLKGVPIKIKRQTDDLHRRLIGIDPPHYGSEQFSAERHSDESMLQLQKKASIAEIFRHRLMACGLITTKSPERWRDRLIAELDEIVTEIEHRCALCKTLYDEPSRYDVLRSLIDPCPACCRRKNNKKQLLLTLQKVLEKSLDSEPGPSESSAGGEDEKEGHDSHIWPITEIPKSRKTRSTTETPMPPLTTQSIVSDREGVRDLQTAEQNRKLKTSWWSHHPTIQTRGSLYTAETTSSANETDGSEYDGRHEPPAVHVINGQPVDNVHDFLQQYMDLVYGGQPGNEQRKQFFLDQLCRNATNGRIVLQCHDGSAGQRRTRFTSESSAQAAEKVSAWHVGEDSDASIIVQKSLLFTTPSLNVLKPKVMGCQSCWTLGRKRAEWDGH